LFAYAISISYDITATFSFEEHRAGWQRVAAPPPVFFVTLPPPTKCVGAPPAAAGASGPARRH